MPSNSFESIYKFLPYAAWITVYDVELLSFASLSERFNHPLLYHIVVIRSLFVLLEWLYVMQSFYHPLLYQSLCLQSFYMFSLYSLWCRALISSYCLWCRDFIIGFFLLDVWDAVRGTEMEISVWEKGGRCE